YHIIGKENSFEQILELVRHGKPLLLEDHVKEWLTALEDPWLRQTESEEANEQVYRLLTSNQAENYLLAFQIIEGGGANDELVGMIAAVMLSHPDQKVAKAAEKLFAKVGPSNALTVFKQKKISFRKSGETVKTLNRLFQTDIGILAIPFRLMHGLIAGENPVIKDVQPGELSFKDCQFNEPFPACARFFEHFTAVDFSRSKGLDVSGALRNMAHWPALRRFDFSGCHCQIPASIGDFTQLTHLDLASNTLEDAPALATMTNLVELSVEGCKIKSWQWLGSLENLETLNLGRNELTTLPNELAGMTGLRSLSLSQNKLKTVGEVLFSQYALYNLDLSNNQISELDYRFFSKLPLDKLSLRSNKISEFDPARLLAATGGRPCGVWELNLASNALTAFKVEKNMFSRLSVLDISKNNVTELDDGIFKFTGVKNLFASENQIAAIPPSIAGKYLQKLFLDKNQLTELPEYFSTTRVENCDLRHNKIEAIPDSFKRKDKDDYSKVYWKLEGNPVGQYSLI
ncbi:MAG: leucine-rich repeat domain-containing protein, partial [Saprospiraceae bacterium]|nr:leucine-rich repeat domain-containing protein [Saprospiraceae bacterium]